MKTSKVLIIYGHPLSDSFNSALGRAYADGARMSGAQVHECELEQMQFDAMLHHGYRKVQALEQDLLLLQKEVNWAEHIVIVFPIWWGGMPVKLKGAIDRCFHPGWAFKYHNGAKFPERLLVGKTGRIILTMDNY
ncbi:MAG: NAD(P)H-dependent oxidoreductase, partial [Lentisphaeria bacterium]